jgi:hypothetical protein
MNPETYRYIYTRDKPMSIKIIGVVAALFSVMGLAYSPFSASSWAWGASVSWRINREWRSILPIADIE